LKEYHENRQIISRRKVWFSFMHHLVSLLISSSLYIYRISITDDDLPCAILLQTCVIDFYNDLLIRFEQRPESLGSSITIQDSFERTLNDAMSLVDGIKYFLWQKADVFICQ